MKPRLTFRRRPFVLAITLAILAVSTIAPGSVYGAESGAQVVVVYNSRLPESKQVAEYYAQRRRVPASQVWGFDLPTTESISRAEFTESLQKPLLKRLDEERLWRFSPATNKLSEPRPGENGFRRVIEAKVRYAALCFGVPVKILKDSTLVEAEAAKMRPEFQRNEAAVDAELANLPRIEMKFPLSGPLLNQLYLATNSGVLSPTFGLLIVTRLDGPSPAIARCLVDKAMEAETNGLWGRAYFDARGLATNDNYYVGDAWIRGAADVARRFGFETVLDTQPATFGAGFPMSQTALYVGWYDQEVSGPFAKKTVEFMPGAFAYHLYSFSAATIRSSANSWVGTLLEQGATCALGAVEEPYLGGTPDLIAFIARLTYFGMTFGEAAYAAQNFISWQTTCIGDPLYRPFGRNQDELHRQLEERQSPLLAWSHLLLVDRNAAGGAPLPDLTRYLEGLSLGTQGTPIGRQSAVLTEKLGDLYWAQSKFTDALDTWEAALRRNPSPQQKLRLLLTLAEKRTVVGPDAKTFDIYQRILKEHPDYPDLLKVYQSLLPIAKRLGKTDAVGTCETEIKRLTPPPAAPTKP